MKHAIRFASGLGSGDPPSVKIAFINSSAEPGKDGVGDYTYSLAAALRELGHSVLVIALRDRWLADPAHVITHDNAGGVSVERLPACLPLPERINRAAARLKEFRPDWASFQMVCYGYHPKGLLFGLNRHLPRLAATCENWHVTFHELWIGFHKGALWKHRIVGALQRHSIKRAIRTLRPKLLQTSTPLFRALLGTIEIEAAVIPLPGNIPVNPDPGLAWFHEVLGEPGIPVAPQQRKEYLAGGFFGAIYPNWEPEPFFSCLRAVAGKTGQKVTIFAAGRMGEGGEAIWSRLRGAYPDFRFQKLGELPAGQVSQYLQNLDFGIAATPWPVIGKSGATAAMLDHGLPVMVTRNDSQPRSRLQVDPPGNPLLILADRDVLDRFLAGLPRRAPHQSARDLAAELVRRMEEVHSAPRFGG
jgi:hypothetical protein